MARRVTKDVTDPEFPHGTERGYFRGCRAECCTEGKRRAHARRDLLKARGVTMTTDVAPVREHLTALLAQHPLATVNAAARAAKVTPRTVAQVVTGETRQRVRKPTAAALMALTLDAVLAEAGLVPAKKPKQQVASLMRLGWPGPYISERLGHRYKGSGPPQFFYSHGRHDADGRPKAQDWMRRDLADRIAALAEEIGDRRGPSPITAERARKRGWHVPGAYDDEGNLIPWAVRRDDDYEAAKERKIEVAERRMRVAEMIEQGLYPAEIARRLDVSVDVVQADKKRGLSRRAEALLAFEREIA